MAETSWWWDGHTTGDAVDAPYMGLRMARHYKYVFTPDPNNQGVIGGTLNELEVNAVTSSSVSVNSGAAIVNGRIYHNDAPVTFALSGASVYWLIGLACNPETQTVRAFARGGYVALADAITSLVHLAEDASPAYPHPYWEIPLAVVLTSASGTITTIYDKRIFAIRPAMQKVFVPAIAGYNYTDTSDILAYPLLGVPLADNKLCNAYGQFFLPENFWDVANIKTVVLCASGGNIFSVSYAEYQSLGDYNYNTHFASSGNTVRALSADISTVVHTLTPDKVERGGRDFLCLTYTRNAVDVADTLGATAYCSGWLVEFNVLV